MSVNKRVWVIQRSEEGFLLLDDMGREVRSGIRAYLLSQLAFDSGADEVRFDYDISVHGT